MLAVLGGPILEGVCLLRIHFIVQLPINKTSGKRTELLDKHSCIFTISFGPWFKRA